MKKSLALASICCLCSFVLSAQQIVWERAFSKSATNEFVAVRSTQDGGCIWGGNVLAKTKPNSPFTNQLWLVKLNSKGQTEWEKQVTDSCGIVFGDFVQTRDKGYVVLAQTYCDGWRNMGVNVYKLSASGEIEWKKTYPALKGDHQFDFILQTKSGGFLLGGTQFTQRKDSFTLHTFTDKGILCSISEQGDVLWSQRYPQEGTMSIASISPINDGGYVLLGTNVVMKISDSGKEIVKKNLNQADFRRAKAIQQTLDGGIMVVGSLKTQHAGVNAWAVKLNSDLSVQWEQSFGGANLDEFNSVVANPDGTFVMGGITNSTDGLVQSGNKGDLDFWLVKVASNGSVIWEKTMGDSTLNKLYSVQRTPEGSYILGGLLSNPFPVRVDASKLDASKKSVLREVSDVKSTLVPNSDNFWILNVKE